MLYIVYGLTAAVSKFSQEHFEKSKLKRIEKITYETENVAVKSSFGVLNTVDSEQEVRACDYVYENHGRIVGFNADQIENAVNGIIDAVLTFSSNELSFLREIKNAYGDHVAIIYAYIEDKALEQITNSIDAPAVQKEHRIKLGKEIKERFLIERELFDEVVVFSGEGTLFDYEALKRQYDYIFKKYKEKENDLVPLPYKGTKPYIFVSYARENEKLVLPYLRILQKNGCRIWYDKGIKGGDNWVTTLAMKIKGCAQYILFSSKESTKSIWTQREARRAFDFPELSILTVRMDDAKFEEGIEWVLGDYQQLFIDSEDFEKRLLDSIKQEVIEKIG